MYLLKMEKALNIGFLIEIIKKQFSIVEEHSIGVKHIGDQMIKYWFCHLLAVLLRTNYLIFLSFSFLIFKMRCLS